MLVDVPDALNIRCRHKFRYTTHLCPDQFDLTKLGVCYNKERPLQANLGPQTAAKIRSVVALRPAKESLTVQVRYKTLTKLFN
jgi:hypothetical protein